MSEQTEQNAKSCCSLPAGNKSAATKNPHYPTVFEKSPPPRIQIRAGMAQVGTDNILIPEDQEGQQRSVRLTAFQIDATCITNQRFEQFVEATGYVTEAEQIGWSFVFHSDVPAQLAPAQCIAEMPWWQRVDGANWRNVNGPGSQNAYHPDHPVVQVSWHDAQAFAHWAKGALPSEAQWEHAARGGLENAEYPWGNREPDDETFQPCNIWQGNFPHRNTCADGFAATAPARSFEPNGYGLFNTCGNVWEWTNDPYTPFSNQPTRYIEGDKVSKGGSFLCHASYCFRYRIAARSVTSPDSASPHQGFRLVYLD